MKPLHSYLVLALIYVLVMSLGLHVGSILLPQIESGAIPPVVAEPEKPSSSLTVFAYILAMTTILLVLMKFSLFRVIKALLTLSLLMGALISLTALSGFFGIPAALLTILLFYRNQKNIWVINAVLIVSLSGVGGLIGASLGIKPALILLILLAVYDIIAVFGTKHMVTLAKESKDRLPLMFTIPLKKSKLNLGTGDIAIPLIFAVSVLRDHSIANSIAAVVGGLVGLTVLFAYILHRKRVTLPALPPITAGLIAGYVAGIIFL